MRRAILAGTLVMSGAATGCMIERPYDVREPSFEINAGPNNTDPTRYAPVRAALDGRIQGDVGPALGLNHDASQLSAYDDGYYLSVEAVVELDDRAAMTLLSISGPETVMQPGYVGDHSLENYQSDGVNVTVLGCVGQEVGVYDEYDMPADDVHLVVSEGPESDVLEVAMTARWFDHDGTTGERLATFREASTSFSLLR